MLPHISIPLVNHPSYSPGFVSSCLC